MLAFDASSELLGFRVAEVKYPALAAHRWEGATQVKPPQFGVTTTLQLLTADWNPKSQ